MTHHGDVPSGRSARVPSGCSTAYLKLPLSPVLCPSSIPRREAISHDGGCFLWAITDDLAPKSATIDFDPTGILHFSLVRTRGKSIHVDQTSEILLIRPGTLVSISDDFHRISKIQSPVWKQESHALRTPEIEGDAPRENS